MGFYQLGSKSAIEVLSGWQWGRNEPWGSAVFFFPAQNDTVRQLQQSAAYHRATSKQTITHPSATPRQTAARLNGTPKQYVVFRNGTWNGLLVTWNKEGQREFWGNYANGQRDGLCCLFDNDRLTAIIECTHNNTNAIHLIVANHITRSLAKEEEISKDTAANAVLERIEEIEQQVKKDVRGLCDRVKKAVQLELSELNKKKRESFNNRSSNRQAQNQAALQAIQKAAGLWH